MLDKNSENFLINIWGLFVMILYLIRNILYGIGVIMSKIIETIYNIMNIIIISIYYTLYLLGVMLYYTLYLLGVMLQKLFSVTGYVYKNVKSIFTKVKEIYKNRTSDSSMKSSGGSYLNNKLLLVFLAAITILLTIITVKVHKEDKKSVTTKSNFIENESLSANTQYNVSISMEGRRNIQIVGKCDQLNAEIAFAYHDGSGNYFTDGVHALIYDDGSGKFSFSLTALDVGTDSVKIMALQNNITGLSLTYHLFN